MDNFWNDELVNNFYSWWMGEGQYLERKSAIQAFRESLQSPKTESPYIRFDSAYGTNTPTSDPPPKPESNVTDQIVTFRFISGKDIIRRNEDGTFGLFHMPIENFLSHGNHEIYSVKTNKGIEFSIGDLVAIAAIIPSEGKITSFSISGNAIFAYFGDLFYEINDLVKKEKPEPTLAESSRLMRDHEEKKMFFGDMDAAEIPKNNYVDMPNMDINRQPLMQPTNQLRWKNNGMSEGVVLFDGDRSMYYVLEQLWKDSVTGKEEWRAIEIVK